MGPHFDSLSAKLEAKCCSTGAGNIDFFNVMLEAKHVTLTTNKLDGDLDGSGAVGFSDLNLVLFNWGVVKELLPSDWINQSPDTGMTVGLEQLNLVLFNWDDTAEYTSSNSIVPVPEPSSISLLLLGASLIARIRRDARVTNL